ncbi:hypothetical protein NOR_01583 [Metarhizium rileyi]|uniref:Uncharacterized protein n=1 Tax=Metarhizium rileyi (strain RCEF 4871) TaxID=1649241 RepID=A0A162M2N1_METRR|nr:hypothetical protein NOR_01583 [Metarhizium rileyi RCEF 4871]
MPRKSIDISKSNESIMLDFGTRKTERSHEENQERAYIAASRRADRSIEARVQSARQASEIHKKRTGKGFKITEEIVMREEMYEEDDDDMPRSIHLLSAHMRTTSGDMNARVESYLANKVAFSHALAQSNLAWRSNDINRAFAESFPNAMAPMPQQNAPQHMGGQGMQGMNQREACSPPIPYSPTAYSPTGYSPQSYSPVPASFSPGMSAPMSTTAATTGGSTPLAQSNHPFIASILGQSSKAGVRRRSVESSSAQGKRRRTSAKSPSARGSRTKMSSPGSSYLTSTSTHDTQPLHGAPLTADTPIKSIETNMGSFDASIFTTDLPAEARMILDGVGADDVLCQTLANQTIFDAGDFNQPWMNPTAFYDPSTMPRTTQINMADPSLKINMADSSLKMNMADSSLKINMADSSLMSDYFGNGAADCMTSKTVMSPPTEDESWGAFINESIWSPDQKQ